MIITPIALTEQIKSRVTSMLRKSKNTEIILENEIPVTSWKILEIYVGYNYNINSKSPSGAVPVITKVIMNNNKTQINLVVSMLDNENNEERMFGVDHLNLEDLYAFYSSISTILTTVTPCYIESIDEQPL